MDLLVIHCDYAQSLWSLVCCLFGLDLVMRKRVVVLLACWKGAFGRHRCVDLWGAVPKCVIWTIWRE